LKGNRRREGICEWSMVNGQWSMVNNLTIQQFNNPYSSQ
jgi:hypothetical protein